MFLEFLWAPRQLGAGPKGAPPTIPPIIINNPLAQQAPRPAIDPRHTPLGPPLTPPPRPRISCRYA